MACALLGASVRAAEPRADIVGTLNRPLREQIAQAIGESRIPTQSAIDARRRAEEAARDVTALLRSEGYYGGLAESDVSAAEPPRPQVRVTTGPRFHLGAGAIDWIGPPPSTAVATAAAAALHLAPAGPGRAEDILAAEGRAIAALHKLGYADAESRPREVIVDHADQSVQPTYRLASGDIARLAGVTINGVSRTDLRFLAGLAPWKPGDAYDPAKLAKLEQRLLESGVYESVTVTLAPTTQARAGLRSVVVGLQDRKTRTLELGAGYSTTQGSGADAKLTLYNRLGRGDLLIFTGRGYDIHQRLDAELDLPDWGRPDQVLKVSGGLLGNRTSAYDDLGGGLRLDVERHWSKTTFVTVGAAFDYASTREKVAVNPLATPVGQDLQLFISTGLAAFALDRSNDPLSPTRGWRLEARMEPTRITGDRNTVYLRGQAQISGYWPVTADLSTVVAGRLKLGSILGGNIPTVPSDRRFFAGGGGSVRGYGYQAVGPRLSDNTPQGGLSLFETGLEVRQRVSSHWGVVAFADAGAVGTGPSPGFNGYGIGAGLGVRYDLGFAPLRLDLATPVKRRRGDGLIQIYISIGQSF